MTKKITLLFLAGVSAFGADPRLQSWIRSAPAPTGIFAPEVQNVRSDNRFVYIESAGISLRSFGILEARPFRGQQARRSFIYSIPHSPQPAAAPSGTPQHIIGVFVTGIPIYNVADAGSYGDQNLWHWDGIAKLDNGTLTTTGRMDLVKEPIKIPPLLQTLLSRNQTHSPLIGFALDGYPIYGPYGWDAQKKVCRFRSSYQLRTISIRDKLPDDTQLTPAQEGPHANEQFPLGAFTEDYQYAPGSGDLDEHNGRFAITPEFPQGTYAYFLATTDSGKLSYPYLIGPTYKGEYPGADVSKLSVYGKSSDLKLLTANPVLHALEPVPLTFASLFPVLEQVHEKQIHLLVISEDLAELDHIHPQPITNNLFRVTHQFAHGGVYWLFADYTPPGRSQTVARFRITVEGPPGTSALPQRDAALSVVRNGIRAALSTDQPLLTGHDIKFKFSLMDAATGSRIQDLEPYLGAWAHIMMVSQDAEDFIHAHALGQSAPASSSGLHTHVNTGPSPSEIETVTGFRRPGLYKLWLQVQRDSDVITFPYCLQVNPDYPRTTSTRVADAEQIKVSSKGYEPSRIIIPSQRPIRLAFTRIDAQNCASRVIFPELGIERELPPNQTVLVEVPAQRAGELHFSCGMGMYRGSLIIR